MAVHLVFKGTERSETQAHELETFCNINGEVFMQINIGDDYPPGFICLDKQTAIRLVKTLKSAINDINRMGDK